MKTKFNHAANDSPRSGSDKKDTPAVWGVIVLAIIAVTLVHAARVTGPSARLRRKQNKRRVVLAKAGTDNPRERFGGRLFATLPLSIDHAVWVPADVM